MVEGAIESYVAGIQLITLKTAFRSEDACGYEQFLFDSDAPLEGVTADIIRQIIRLDDSFSGSDAYEFSDALDRDAYFDEYGDGKLVLYAITRDDGGDHQYAKILSTNTPFSSSADLFLKRIDDGRYINIYSLTNLKKESYADKGTATKMTAILYACSCYQKKLIDRHIMDLDALKEEQEIMNDVSTILSAMINELNEGTASSRAEDNSDAESVRRPINKKVWAFFATRDLLQTVSNTDVTITENSLVKCLDAVKRTFEVLADSHAYWTADDFENFTDILNESTVPGESGAVSTYIAEGQVNTDQAMSWADALRIYTEQINTDGNSRSTRLQTIQQQGQQAALVASNLMKSAMKVKMDVVNNMR
jgi:hypothetical protein